MPETIGYKEFAKKIKEKYPQYNDIDDFELSSMIVDKYPDYKGSVDLKKKENFGSLSEIFSTEKLQLDSNKGDKPEYSDYLPKTSSFLDYLSFTKKRDENVSNFVSEIESGKSQFVADIVAKKMKDKEFSGLPEDVRNSSLQSAILEEANKKLGSLSDPQYIDDKDVESINKYVSNVVSSKVPFAEKFKILDGIAENYALSMPESIRDDVRKEINALVGDAVYSDKNGNISEYGIRRAAYDNMVNIKPQMEDALRQYASLQSQAKTIVQGSGYNISTYHYFKDDATDKIYTQKKKEYELLSNAYGKFKDVYELPEGGGNFLEGLSSKGLDWFVSGGMSDLLDDSQMANIAAKAKSGEKLDEVEQSVVDAYGLLRVAGEKTNIGRWYKAGVSTVESLPFIAQFFTTGGIGSGVRGSVNTALKTSLKKGLSKYARIGVAEVVSSAARVPIFPETYKKTVERMTGELKPSESGGKIFDVDEDSIPSIVESVYKGGAETFSEIFTESLGGVPIPNGINNIVNKIVPGGAKKIIKNKFVDGLKQYGKDIGLHSPPAEFIEEVISSVMQRVLTGEGKISDAFDKDELITTAYAVSAMGGIFGGITAPMNIKRSIDVKLMDDLRSRFGDNIISDIDSKIQSGESVEDIVGYVSDIISSAEKSGVEINKNDLTNLIKYSTSIVYNKFNSETIDELGVKDIVEPEKQEKNAEERRTDDQKVSEQGGIEEGGQEVERLRVRDAGEYIEEAEGETSRKEITVSGKKEVSEPLKRVLKTGSEGVFERVVFSENKEVGSVVVEEKEDKWEVKRVDVYEERKGYGKALYRKLNKDAGEYGKVLSSDRADKISDKAKGLWESLVRSNEAEKLSDGSYVMIPSKTDVGVEKEPKKGKMKLGVRALESSLISPKLKKVISDKGIEYAIRTRNIVSDEADAIVNGLVKEGHEDELASIITNTANDVKPDTRTFLAANLSKEYIIKAAKTSDPVEKQGYIDKAGDMMYFGMKEGTVSGQAVNAQKIWKEIYGELPEAAAEIHKSRTRRKNDAQLIEHENDISNAYKVLQEDLSPENINKIIKEKLSTEKQRFYDELKKSRDRIERGKAKLASGSNKLANIIGAKKSLLQEDNSNIIAAIIEIADGTLDLGVGSISMLMTNIKKHVSGLVEPDFIDRHKDKILEATDARKRIEKNKVVVSEKEVGSISDKIYGKMEIANKKQLKKLVRNYIETLVEEGTVSEQRFKDMYARSMGLNTITPKQEAQIIDNATKIRDVRIKSEGLSDKYDEYIEELKKAKPSEKKLSEIENEINILNKEHKKLFKEAEKSNAKLSDIMADETSLFDLISTVIQGNLMAPISLTRNVVGNYAWQPVRFAKTVISSAAEKIGAVMGDIGLKLVNESSTKNRRIVNILRKMSSAEKVYDLFAIQKGYFIGSWEGLKEGVGQLKTGMTPEDVFRRDASKAIHPIRTWTEGFKNMPKKERIKFGVLLKKSIETFPGIEAEVLFRLLNLGDKPARRGAERAMLENIASIKGLKGKEKEKFLKFPDKESMDEAHAHGIRSVFQQENGADYIIRQADRWAKNKTLDEKAGIFGKIGYGVYKLLRITNIPFVKTPSNIAIEAFEYALPEYSAYRWLAETYRGNKRQALDYFGKMVIGGTIRYMVMTLISKGLMSLGQAGEEEEGSGATEKIKASEYENLNAYSINMSALNRWIGSGFDDDVLKWRETDDIYSYKNLGVVSAIMMGQAAVYSNMTDEEAERVSSFMGYFSMLKKSLPATVSSSLEQSFVQGLNTGMNALLSGDEKKLDMWYLNMARGFSSLAIPNTYAQIVQYNKEYIKETSDISDPPKEFKNKLTNTFKDRLFTEDGLPTKITVWGEKVRRVPEGMGIGYLLWDVGRKREYQSTFGVKLHELYVKLANEGDEDADKLLPQPVSKTFKFMGESIRLSPALYEELAVQVGQLRKMFTEPLVNSSSWDELPDAMKKEMLSNIYSKGNYPGGNENLMKKTKDMFMYKNFNELMDLYDKQVKKSNAK